MTTRTLLRSLIALVCFFPFSGAFAQARRTPVETFIKQVGETNTFVPVSNIWQPDNNYDKTAMLEKVNDAQPLTIDYSQVTALIQQNNTAISLVIPGLNGATYTIDLAQYKFLSNDFEIHVKGSGTTDNVYDYTPGLYYSGVVHGIPGSLATFSFFNNEVYGLFSIPGVGNFNVVPNVMAGKYYNYNQHYVVYNEKDLKLGAYAPQCATDKLPAHHTASTAKTTTIVGDSIYNNCTQINVFEVGDYALYVTKGHSVTNVSNYLTALFNNQALLYRNEGVLIDLKYVQVDSTVDAWNSISSANSVLFLDKFGYITGNTLHGCDLAILASTCLSSGYGALGGVAWLQAMCQTYYAPDSFGSYAFCDMDNSGVTNFPTFSWDVEVITHEMGHVVGSPHTHRCCWNPPGSGTTAIDGCYTLEGSCAIPSPALPVGGGTIMSYCHLTSDGINLSNGFGTQPGDTIRYYIAHHVSSTCGSVYSPSVALQKASRTVTANRECTNMTSGITYYWKDNNTADQSDDTLVLMIKKNGNTIGDLNTAGFSVTANTIVNYGAGFGDTITSFPAGTAGLSGRYYGMRRYYNINSTSVPATNVEVMYPFLATDTVDVDGSVPGAAALSNYLFYHANSPINPNPIGGFTGGTAADFTAYTYSTTASTTHWSFSTVGSTYLAHMLMTNLAGGGTGMYTGCPGVAAPTPASIPTVICTGATAVYSVNPIATALSYVWTITGTGWTGSSTTNSISLTAGSGVGVISVAAVDTCGAGTAYTFTITPSAIPAEVITAPAILCQGSTTEVFTTTATGGPVSYTWAVSGTGWSGSSTTSTITPVVGTGTGMLIVTGYNSCGAGVPDTLVVTPGTVPDDAINITATTSPLCSGGTGVFTTPAATGATSYTWTVSGTGWSGSSSTTSSITVTLGAASPVTTGTITVTPVNACGSGNPFTLNTILPNETPTASFAVTPSHVTNTHVNITISYTGTAPAGTTYTWDFGGGVASPGTGFPGPQTVHWNASGVYTVSLTVSNGGCSATFTDTVHVNASAGIASVNNNELNADIVPNPNEGSFDIVFDHALNTAVSLKLYDMQGRIVYTNEYSSVKNNSLPVTTVNLPAGTYAASIYANGSVITKKLTITK